MAGGRLLILAILATVSGVAAWLAGEPLAGLALGLAAAVLYAGSCVVFAVWELRQAVERAAGAIWERAGMPR